MTEKKRTSFLLIFMIAAAAVMRFLNAGEMSWSNDELSALYRLKADSLAMLWQEGVRVDGHPAFVQTLLYLWIRIFPDTPGSIRIPFILAGTGALIYAFLLGRKWIGTFGALCTVTCMAFLEYPILYSQLARPYAFGLLFTLMTAWHWSSFFFGNKNRLLHSILFTIGAALAMYTHYFSFLMVLIMSATGILFIRKELVVNYLLSGLGIILLFLPHLGITFFQLHVGGVGGWLGAPSASFFSDHLLTVFNHSPFVIAVVCLAFIPPLIYGKNREISVLPEKKVRGITAAWFMIPLLTGYFYSIYVNPVLQHSVLLFSYPFLLLFLFSFTGSMPFRRQEMFVALLAITCIGSTAAERNYYGRYHFGEYKDVAAGFHRWKQEYGDSITQIAVLVNREYLDVYLSRKHPYVSPEYSFQQLTPDLRKIRRIIADCPTPYLSIGWTNTYFPGELPAIAREYFPYTVQERQYFNAGMFLLSKNKTAATDVPNRYAAGFPMDSSGFMRVEPQQEFAVPLEIQLKKVVKYSSDLAQFQIIASVNGENCNPQLVISIERNGKSVFWRSRNFGDQAPGDSGWQSAYITERLAADEIDLETDLLKAYVWNPGKCSFAIRSATLTVYPGNPILYGYD